MASFICPTCGTVYATDRTAVAKRDRAYNTHAETAKHRGALAVRASIRPESWHDRARAKMLPVGRPLPEGIAA